MVKLICADIDGTLLNRHREVDEYTQRVFRQLVGQVPVVLASSRMPRALWYVQEALGAEDMPLICYNGALILAGGRSFSEDLVLASETIGREAVQLIVGQAAGRDVHYSIYYNNRWVASRMDQWTEREANNTRTAPDEILAELASSERNIHQPAHKIMLMGEPSKLDEIVAAIAVMPGILLCRSKDSYLEITPAGIDKSYALQLLLGKVDAFKDIAMADVMAFGDNHNDYELLRDVGYGIVVGNGILQLKEIAYAVAAPNHEHGVARYLEDHFGAGNK